MVVPKIIPPPPDDYKICECFGRPFKVSSVYCSAVDAKYSKNRKGITILIQ
jgi:hypothetical protein